MANRVQAIEAKVIEGDLYQVPSEDGNLILCNYFVVAQVGELTYIHPVPFFGHVADPEDGYNRIDYNAKPRAEHLVERIYKAGLRINLDLWAPIDLAPRCAGCGEILCSAPCACHDLNS